MVGTNMFAKRMITGLTAVTLLLVPLCRNASAQTAPAPPTASGPIDIQAAEQEFSGDEIIAKGDVHVKYKDSIILGPQARLKKDAGGNPQQAVFTGHPHLTQGSSKMDAEILTFDVATSHVLAEGHAHSEVMDSGDAKPEKKDATGGGANKKKANAGGKNTDGKNTDGKTADSSSDQNSTEPATTDTAAAIKKLASTPPPPEKIITDSDRQEYDRQSGKFIAVGHVHVVHGNIMVKADKLQLVYGVDNKPETALFSGNVSATQDRNTTTSDNMTYSLSNRRLEATGHVKSTVIQEHRDDPKKKKDNTVSSNTDIMPAAEASEEDQADDDIIVIYSETQDFSRDSNRMSAHGNVKLYYGDLVGTGPGAVLLRDSQNKPERIIFAGRSQITQPNKRWIADHLEMIVATKLVVANGNTKVVILKAPPTTKPASPTQTQLAGTGNTTR